ncbi:hypothetical protein CXG81DRAFT_24278 [Caulochytrium protostelioides]|uniref:Uncharacterized protein n=1 Tax=Caulochytrium protostelioides TaxID=1555241 RepID=A0A4P9XD36_9FUNG|nr:hypothetical protein CXG81DRAFT_24278 [Caulochytrium protostelioides]|eukprot:RKP03071.1 hypothetical protein CXG81DRAFT_24278 [Caulochytrium protostelioides]
MTADSLSAADALAAHAVTCIKTLIALWGPWVARPCATWQRDLVVADVVLAEGTASANGAAEAAYGCVTAQSTWSLATPEQPVSRATIRIIWVYTRHPASAPASASMAAAAAPQIEETLTYQFLPFSQAHRVPLPLDTAAAHASTEAEATRLALFGSEGALVAAATPDANTQRHPQYASGGGLWTSPLANPSRIIDKVFATFHAAAQAMVAKKIVPDLETETSSPPVADTAAAGGVPQAASNVPS